MPRPPDTQASLSEVAGRRVHLLGGLTAPLYLAGALIADGMTRWVILLVGLIIAGVPLIRRQVGGPGEALFALLSSAGVVAMWAWLIPDAPQIAATVLCASTAYNALMIPRGWAEAGLAVLPIAYAVTPVVHGSGTTAVAQAIGVAVANMMVGALLLGIRITTERRTAEHTAALAAANDRLAALNRIDPLTGLANRRSLDEALATAWTRATDEPVGFLMIDIDYFKRYNDHYGHQGGDDCLRMIATLLSANVRETSVVARYGGEEFSVVVPGAGTEEVAALAERIRSAVAALHAGHAAAPDGFVSVSVGAAALLPAGNDPDDLVRAADRALYEAKRHGRNRVSV